MKTTKFHNDYVKLASAKWYKKAFTIVDGHIQDAYNWCREDVIGQMDDADTPLSDAEIDYIMYRMVDNHDAELGICWAVIDSYIYEILDARKKGESI